MTVPRSVSDVLADHVTLEIDCIDRMYLNVYQPKLQFAAGIVGFLRRCRQAVVPSTVLIAPMTEDFVKAVHRFAARSGIPWVDFVKGQRKDDIAHEYLARFAGAEGVLFVGRAQEKATVFQTEKRRNRTTGQSYPWITPVTRVVNHFYFYCVDDDFGPFFLKFCSYFPYNAKLCLNGHEWAKRQAEKAGIGFTALDNGFAACTDPGALQAICDRFGPADIDALLRRWLARLPHPYRAGDRAAGYRYDLSILQAEFSRTQVLDRPLTGRVFFEEVIRENLDIGRPDHVGLVFGRKNRIARRALRCDRFRTRVLTDGVTPSLHVDYKHCRIKQYHKENRALRTETTINDSTDFRIGKRLCNLPALRQVGFSANRRLLTVERLSHDPTLGDDALTALTTPAVVGTQRAAALRFDDPRAHALLSALLIFRLLPRGSFTSRDLRSHLAPLLGVDPDTLTQGRLTYQLRRLRLHGLIDRIPGSHRYQITDLGLRTALFLTRAYNRLLRPGLSELTDPSPPLPTQLRRCYNAFIAAVDSHTQASGLAA